LFAASPLEESAMSQFRRIDTTNFAGTSGDVTIVKFVDRKIIDATAIQELGEELFSLVERDGLKSQILNFASVEFLSSAALNKLIMLDKKIKAVRGKLRLCNLRPEIYEVFAITRLNVLFDIKPTEAEALAGFYPPHPAMPGR
jgi:anti-sigma B factor antagonist